MVAAILLASLLDLTANYLAAHVLCRSARS